MNANYRIGRAFLILSFLLPSIPGFGAFEQVNMQARLFRHPVPPADLYNDPVSVAMSGGASTIDLNEDGWPDIVLTFGTTSPAVYINNRNGTFTLRSSDYSFAHVEGTNTALFVDIDNDGDKDCFISSVQGTRYYLYEKISTGNYREIAQERGVDLQKNDNHLHHGFSVSAADFNRDGYLDLHTCEWDSHVDETTKGDYSVLFRNRGSSAPGYFDNVTVQSGVALIGAGSSSLQHAFTSNWADFDGDGWQDLAIASDFGTSRLFWNNGDGTFSDGTSAAQVGHEENGMGGTVGDFNNDGLLDWFVTSIYNENTYQSGVQTGNRLYQNVGNRIFVDATSKANVRDADWGWGAAFFDYNNDGLVDIVAAAGVRVDVNTGVIPESQGRPVLWRNNGDGTFSDVSEQEGLTDRLEGKSVSLTDYNRDGLVDILISNTAGFPMLYENRNNEGNHFIRFKLIGNTSPRDALGAKLTLTSEQNIQIALYNPTSNFLGQHEDFIQFGVGRSTAPVTLSIIWPSGIEQVVENLPVDQEHTIEEAASILEAPHFITQPQSIQVTKDQPATFTADVEAIPSAVYRWLKNGEIIEGASGPTLTIERVIPSDEGVYTGRAINSAGSTDSEPATLNVSLNPGNHSVAHLWNEMLMEAIRKDFPNPTVHSRNLYHLSAAMWDTFWAYEPDGWSKAMPIYHQELLTENDWFGNRLAAQREAISHAAYQVLMARYANSVGADDSLYNFIWLMLQLGYDPMMDSTIGQSPAAVGNRIGQAILAATLHDGANEENHYADTSGYLPVNEPMIVALPGTILQEPNHWQPLSFQYSVTQNGIVEGAATQKFVGVNWRAVTPFALVKSTPISLSIDPGPPPQFGTATHQTYVESALQVMRYSSWLDPSDGVMIDISPAAMGNNPLGTNAGTGYAINPVTHQPYASQVVARGDFGRVLAEFWADGPESETPPGHWNVLHNDISDYPEFSRRWEGKGPELSPLEWDVRAYLTLNGAMHDAAITAWTLKRQYDFVRPVSMIRYLGSLGQSSNPDLDNYNELAFPILPGFVELITSESSAPGERHEHLAGYIGKIAIHVWAGQPPNPHTDTSGVGWILSDNWVPYQKSTFVTPAFAAYVSGHSTFSRAGAEVMTAITGSPYFPGGLGQYTFHRNDYLEFELGPSSEVTLQWATYYDAADQAGVSRLWGGIHINADDMVGRHLGSTIGKDAVRRVDQLLIGN